MALDQKRRLVLYFKSFMISDLGGRMNAGAVRAGDMVAKTEGALLAFPPKVGPAISLQPCSILLKQVAIPDLRDLASVTLIGHLNSSMTEVAGFVWPKVLWPKLARVMPLASNDDVLKLLFAMLEDCIDGFEWLALLEVAVIVILEDLSNAVNSVEELIDDGIEISGSQGV